MDKSILKNYTITQVAKISGLAASTLRYYESIGIIHQIDRDNFTNRRVYSEDDLNLIIAIACLNAIGLSIDEMKKYLENSSKSLDGAREQIDLLKAQLDKQIDEMHYSQLRIEYVKSKILYWQSVIKQDENAIESSAAKAYEIAAKMKLPKIVK